MKLIYKSVAIAFIALMTVGCNSDDTKVVEIEKQVPVLTGFNFDKVSSFSLSNEGFPEISAYDKVTKQVFSTNTENKVVEVVNISDISAPKFVRTIDVTPYGGNVNSVAVKNEMLAIAIEGNDKQRNKGRVVVFQTSNLVTPIINVEAGFLPDMVTFSPDAKYILVANEGEPNDLATIDPKGSISIIDVAAKSIETLDFTKFNGQEEALEAQGFRVFGETRVPLASNPDKDASRSKNLLDVDVEPEYIVVSDDSKMAYVVLQENNGIAVVDILTKTITEILPLGTKDFNDFEFDVSDKDDALILKNWNVKGFYQPDAIDYFTVNNIGYLISANEGDGREYLDDKGTEDEDDDVIHFTDEIKVEKMVLDETVYADVSELQKKSNLGRLKAVSTSGDADSDGKTEQIFTFGGRSFTIWSLDGSIVYDSGDFLTKQAIALGTYPDGRSDAKGTEPESVTTLKLEDKTLAFIGMERSGNVFVFDISNPLAPIYLQNLDNTSPEGLVAVPAKDSPNGKDLLIVSNENGGDLVIYSRE